MDEWGDFIASITGGAAEIISATRDPVYTQQQQYGVYNPGYPGGSYTPQQRAMTGATGLGGNTGLILLVIVAIFLFRN
jgi:hypothetical protein